MKIFTTFFKERGWLHNTGMLPIIYLILVWGHSNYAQKTELVPSAMMADLVNTGFIGSLIVLTFFAGVTGWILEVIEETMGAKFSYWDIFWTALGAPFAFVLYHFFPHSTPVLVLSILYLAFTIWQLYKTLKGKK
ncbi:hypothetical protein [Flavobacterium sp. 25HG05S-40]|uniref:hypothetical protein n=1 Tax=Flavobacterium sp. 25HG05S-40 TaxID=3458682 RepID=UPI0040445D5B